MINVEFKSVSAGKCAWCRKEKEEIFAVAFSDQSFVGPLCKADLLRAIGMKLGAHGERKPIGAPAAVPAGNNVK